MSIILAGDVGGTKIRLALYQYLHATFRRLQLKTFESRKYSGLGDAINRFLANSTIPVEAACFGVAGPVIKGEAKITNLPWILNEKELADRSGIRFVKLVNDLAATAAAIPYLTKDDLETLHPGEQDPSAEIYAVLAPGTGLGMGYLIQDATVFHPLPSEGGHADFAPNNADEIALLKYLMPQFKHVSYERVLCGQGLVNIYQFLKSKNAVDDPKELAERFEVEDPAAVISTLGIQRKHELCVKALDIFVSILGAQAGNLALTFMATGGIFLGGGIPPKLLKKLIDGTIVRAYLNKGRLSQVVKKTPLHVIRNEHSALLGAASIATKSHHTS